MLFLEFVVVVVDNVHVKLSLHNLLQHEFVIVHDDDDDDDDENDELHHLEFENLIFGVSTNVLEIFVFFLFIGSGGWLC